MLREEISDWGVYFAYDADLGVLIWKRRKKSSFQSDADVQRWNTKVSGKTAGTIGTYGYVIIDLLRGRYKAHRIIWEMHHGPIPPGMLIDHIDGCALNNKISNLRLSSKSQNGMNRPKCQNTTSGLKGVYANRKKWSAKIKNPGGKMIHLGTYSTKAEAAVVFAKASLRYHGRFSVFYRSIASNA